MTRLAALLLFVASCTDHKASTNEPVITGDSCALYTDATSCNADPACMYFGTGCACPPNDPSCTCSPGACGSKSGSGSGSGSGSSTAACACPNGEVCFEQIGGPAQMSGTSPTIECTLPASGTGDPCPRIQGEGTCTDSTTVSGLCVCDNGIR
ncbi:MAG: hypothetical protein ACM31C_05000 [Acidobacteriota bacterium]